MIAAVAKVVVIATDRCLLVIHGSHLQEDKQMVLRLGDTASLPIAPALIEESSVN